MPISHIRSSAVPDALRGYVALHPRTGRPRYWASVWAATAGAHLAPTTLHQYLSAIERLYLSVERQLGTDDLDDIIAEMDFARIEHCLGGYFAQVQNEASRRPSRHTRAWTIAYQFIKDVLARLAQSESESRRIDKVNAKLLRLNNLYASLRPARTRAPVTMRALPSVVIEDIYEIIAPRSARNPFRTDRARWRNHALVLLCLHQGLRRGEVLLLHADPVHEEYHAPSDSVRRWINVTESASPLDNRAEKPSIKTHYSHRQIPISPTLAAIVRTFTANWRGKQPHPFLFSSNRKQPLSLSRVNRIFARISGQLSPAAQQALRASMQSPDISPHDLRHTCAVVRLTHFLDQGVPMDVALQKLRAFFGWTLNSEMPRLYARAYFENR